MYRQDYNLYVITRKTELHTEFWWGNSKGPLKKSERRWEENIKTNLKMGWEGEEQFHLAHERDK